MIVTRDGGSYEQLEDVGSLGERADDREPGQRLVGERRATVMVTYVGVNAAHQRIPVVRAVPCVVR